MTDQTIDDTMHPVRNNVIFQFIDDTAGGRFLNTSQGGLYVSSGDTNQSNVVRWVKITHVGPEVLDVKPGDFALVDEGKWTPGFYVNHRRYWKTDDEQLIATADQPFPVY